MSILAKEPYLRFHLFLSEGGKEVRTFHSGKQRRVVNKLTRYSWDFCRIAVDYGDTGFSNAGEYRRVEDVRAALSAFTEPELIADVFGLSIPVEESEDE